MNEANSQSLFIKQSECSKKSAGITKTDGDPEFPGVHNCEFFKLPGPDAVEVFRVKFPWGMDANEYAQKVQPSGGFDKLTAGKALQTLLNAAEWMGGAYGCQLTKLTNRRGWNFVKHTNDRFGAWTCYLRPSWY